MCLRAAISYLFHTYSNINNIHTAVIVIINTVALSKPLNPEHLLYLTAYFQFE